MDKDAMTSGHCHCGAVKFEVHGDAVASSLCYCSDCRMQSGAPVVAWAMVPVASLKIDGEPMVYNSSEFGRRSFCKVCGTGLFFTNEPLDQMEMVQVRIAALANPEAVAPTMQVQTAERIDWMIDAHLLPAFERFPD